MDVSSCIQWKPLSSNTYQQAHAQRRTKTIDNKTLCRSGLPSQEFLGRHVWRTKLPQKASNAWTKFDTNIAPQHPQKMLSLVQLSSFIHRHYFNIFHGQSPTQIKLCSPPRICGQRHAQELQRQIPLDFSITEKKLLVEFFHLQLQKMCFFQMIFRHSFRNIFFRIICWNKFAAKGIECRVHARNLSDSVDGPVRRSALYIHTLRSSKSDLCMWVPSCLRRQVSGQIVVPVVTDRMCTRSLGCFDMCMCLSEAELW